MQDFMLSCEFGNKTYRSIRQGIVPREMAIFRIIFHLCVISACSLTLVTGKHNIGMIVDVKLVKSHD